MSLILQISDPHFGTERTAVVEALHALVEAQSPDLIILSGDITQRARPAEYAAARRFCDRLGPALQFVIPGNHDIPLFNLPARLLFPWANFRRAFGPLLEPDFESPQLLVLAVNTTRPYRHKNGEISMRQRERVAQRLQAARPGQLRIVVCHHPLAVIRAEDVADQVRGARQALRCWTEAGVDLVLGGHIHLPYVLEVEPGSWVVQAGTAVSSRVRHEAGNSVNLIRYHAGEARQCSVERWDYNAAHNCFVPATLDELRLVSRPG